MVFRNIFFLAICFFLQQSILAQNNSIATQPGAKIVTSTFLFSSRNGTNFTGSDEKLTSLGGTMDYLNFFSNRLAAGPRIAVNYIKQGEFKQIGWNIGPKAVYFFDYGSNNLPYIGTSLSYLNQKYGTDNRLKIQGLQADFTAGLAIRKGHLFILLESGYNFQKPKNNDTNTTQTANNFYLSIGLGASIFKS